MTNIFCLIKHILNKPLIGERITDLTQLKPGDKIYVKKNGVFACGTVNRIGIYQGGSSFNFEDFGKQIMTSPTALGMKIYKYE